MQKYKVVSEILDLDYEHMTAKVIIRTKSINRNSENIMFSRNFRKNNTGIMNNIKLDSPLTLLKEDEESKLLLGQDISKINGETYIYYDKNMKKYYQLEVSE